MTQDPNFKAAVEIIARKIRAGAELIPEDIHSPEAIAVAACCRARCQVTWQEWLRDQLDPEEANALTQIRHFWDEVGLTLAPAIQMQASWEPRLQANVPFKVNVRVYPPFCGRCFNFTLEYVPESVT